MKLYLRQKYREGINFRLKLRTLTIVIAIGFTILLLRLAILQIISGNEFKKLSDRNRIRLLRLKAPRGLVYDRNGRLLIDNRPSFTVSIVPAEAWDPEPILGKILQFIEFDKSRVLAKIQAAKYAPFKQIIVAQDVSMEEAAAIEEYSLDLPGIVITAEPCRRFPLGKYASQTLGYPGEINSSELEKMAEYQYRMGDLVGKTGIELVAEKWLRGQDGGMQIQVYSDASPQMELDATGSPRVRIDTAGRRLVTLGDKPPVAGNIVRLELDADMQRIVDEEMVDREGAVVVLNAETGAIRAITSKPAYDPNVFVSVGENSERLALLNDSARPLLNRALQSYPPGSTFKTIMAYAALNEGVITLETRHKCTGSFRLGRRFRCWKDSGHGSMNIVEALAYSCDVFFYNVGHELGIDRINKYAHMFGLGELTGIDLPGETRGLIPSREWKRNAFRNPSDRKWYDGETINASIGQGYTLTTPLQLAQAYAAVVNGGRLMRPYLINSVWTPDNSQTLFKNDVLQQKTLDNKEALEIIRVGLKEAIESRKPFYGTGWRAKNKSVSLIGKTGTAQVVSFKERAETEEELAKVRYEHRDHAWFVAVTEDTEEPLVIVALCEHAGHASESAVPIVREIVKRFAEIDIQDDSEIKRTAKGL